MTTKITKTWTTQSGAVVTVNGELITEKKVWLDGDEDTVKCCEIYISVNHSKAGYLGSSADLMTAAERKHLPAGTDPALFTHICGKMALTADKAEIINSVRRELEALPEWQAHLTRQAKAEAEDAEYRAHVARVNKMMNY